MWTEIDDCSQRLLFKPIDNKVKKKKNGNNCNDMFKMDKCWLLNDIFMRLKFIDWLS